MPQNHIKCSPIISTPFGLINPHFSIENTVQVDLQERGKDMGGVRKEIILNLLLPWYMILLSYLIACSYGDYMLCDIPTKYDITIRAINFVRYS